MKLFKLTRKAKREWFLLSFFIIFFLTLYFLITLRSNTKKFTLQPPPEGYYYFEFQKNYLKYSQYSLTYEIAVISDKDKNSKNPKGYWESILKKGILTRDSLNGRYSISWKNEVVLTSNLAADGRGMELSELVWFNGRLLAPDDRTGVVYSIEEEIAIPQFILMDGNGRSSKACKVEWGTVKDGLVYFGSMGKEWSDSNGNTVNNNPQWIKTIDKNGKIEHKDWSIFYSKMRKASGADFPGYLLHEAGAWNPILKKWFFLPRRFSTEPYDEVLDEQRGTNLMITADENFKQINVTTVGNLIKTRGFSSVVFLPGREFELVALKSEEFSDKIASYIIVINVETGAILMEEEYFGNIKFEGIEII